MSDSCWGLVAGCVAVLCFGGVVNLTRIDLGCGIDTAKEPPQNKSGGSGGGSSAGTEGNAGSKSDFCSDGNTLNDDGKNEDADLQINCEKECEIKGKRKDECGGLVNLREKSVVLKVKSGSENNTHCDGLSVEIVGASAVHGEGLKMKRLVIRDSIDEKTVEVRLTKVDDIKHVRLENVHVSKHVEISPAKTENKNTENKNNVGTLKLSNVRAEELELSGLRAGKIELENVRLRSTLGLRETACQNFLKAERIYVGGRIEAEHIKGQCLDLSESIAVKSVELNESDLTKLVLNEMRVEENLSLDNSRIIDLNARDLSVKGHLSARDSGKDMKYSTSDFSGSTVHGAVDFENFSADSLDLSDVKMEDEFNVKKSRIGYLKAKKISVKGEIVAEELHAKDADFQDSQWENFHGKNGEFGKLNLYNATSSGYLELDFANQNAQDAAKMNQTLDLSWAKVGRVSLRNSRWNEINAGNLKVTHTMLSARWSNHLNLKQASVDVLDLYQGEKSGNFSRFEMDNAALGKVIYNSTVEKSPDGDDICQTIRDLKGVSQEGKNENLFLAVSQHYKSQGKLRDANHMDLVGRWHASESFLEWASLLVLNGIGNPFVYILWFLAVWLLATCIFFYSKPSKPPANPAKTLYVVSEIGSKIDRWEIQQPGDTPSSPPAWLYALRLMVRGEPWEHLKEQKGWNAVGHVAVRLLGLLFMGLIVFSVLALVPR